MDDCTTPPPTAKEPPHHRPPNIEAANRELMEAAAESENGGPMSPRSNGQAQRRQLIDAGYEPPKDRQLIDYGLMTCAQLDAADLRTEYLVQYLLAARQPCIVAGPKKSLKTSLLLDLFVSLATATDFLGQFPVPFAVRCALLSGESGLNTIQETLRRICTAAGLRLADIGGLMIGEKLPKFGDPAHVRAVKDMILGNELEVVGIDPAYLAMPGDDAANVFKMGEMLREVAEVCTDTGCTMVLCHHTKKGVADPCEPPELEHIAFAGFQEWARQWLLVGRREQYEPGTGEHKLWLNVGGSAGHSGLWALDITEGQFPRRTWAVEVSKATEARKKAAGRQEETKRQEAMRKAALKLEEDRMAVCRLLARKPEGETMRGIRDAGGINQARLAAAINSLLDDKHIGPALIVKHGHKKPYEGYKLTDRE